MEISLSSMRISDFSPTVNDELMKKQLDSLEEREEMAAIWLASYQQKLAQRYDKGMRLREFCVGYLVLCRTVLGTSISENLPQIVKVCIE